MCKRMDYSVVGLPHYTIWHLYEPSADDLRHMDEMERERLEREKEEKEKADREAVVSATFENPGAQWMKDKQDMDVEDLKYQEAVEAKQAEIAAEGAGAKNAEYVHYYTRYSQPGTDYRQDLYTARTARPESRTR